MTLSTSRPADNYSPIYFLASVGAGGLVASFFVYLLFWVPHKDKPVPTVENIISAFDTGGLAMQAMIIVALSAIAIGAYVNIRYLIWNLSSYSKFKKTETYTALRNSNGESSILAMPLALAMTVNVGFILGLVFVPGLWGIIEYLFPLALIAFSLIAVLAFKMIGEFLGRIFTKAGSFDVKAHNSFAQLVPAFALSMIAVGMAAPAAMSQNITIVGISLVLSTIVGLAAMIYAVVAGVTAFSSMLQNGAAKEASPTLMIIIPLMTVLAITFLRQDHGLHTQFDVHVTNGETMSMLTKMFAIQLLFLAFGMAVLIRNGYFKDFVFGDKTSPGSYALACPGIALSVMTQFFVNKGLVAAGLLVKFSVAYWFLTAFAIAFQIAMIVLIIRLNRQHFGKVNTPSAIAAE